jgi:ABC-type sulfate transport system substrate-binding protein
MDALVVRDTHKLIATLQKRGFSAQQAEGITDALRDLDASELATKADIRDLKTDLQQLRIDFEKALHRQTWAFLGIIFAQGAFVIAVLQYLR